MKPAFTFKIGGEAGFGIMAAGTTFAKVAMRSGYYVFDYSEYPSLIRGGHNVMQISVADEPVNSQYQTTNFLIALNQQTLDLHKNELIEGAGVLYDADQNIKVADIPDGVDIYAIPFTQVVKQAGGSYVMRNSVALAAALALLGANMQHLKDLIAEEFAGKEELIKINHEVCEAGAAFALEKYKSKNILSQKQNVVKQILVTGNDATALGAIAGGMTFTSIYPMTPTSNILHILAPFQEKFNFVYKQPEDEISAINMAIGASFAGARAMVATSGGGFCLMSEGYGLAGMTEIPIVIIEGMRGAPATGLPTWTEQGDLRFVLHAHQGEFPRIVLAAGNVEDAFNLALRAFNLADKYQTPVLILVDKYVCESHMSVVPFEYEDFKIDRGNFSVDKIVDYKRYEQSDTGVSTRTIPGISNYIIANSDEHDVFGFSDESSENRITQMNKRMKKLATCEETDMQEPKVFGSRDADISFISWGSNKGPILEALKSLPNANYLHLEWLNPFPSEFIGDFLKKAKRAINIECNYSGQMAGYIAEKTGFRFEEKNNFLKFDGRPFYPEEIVKLINNENTK
ncbi:MAG TPA: 2-oxoacid:acceptor oxidoreductase subunit alpha [Candidatus Saccharimonadales bacterium]|nr:2-oxoacid:acceptor oxidoreductase subunit alpha [Candidatus Saccharimonadales bacterium]